MGRLIDADMMIMAMPEIMKWLSKKAPSIDIVWCSECEFLKVYNKKDMYAVCTKFDIVFDPFGDNTKKNFCSWGEKRLPRYTDCAWKEGE